jgi:ribosomal protein S6--L-glutamate ligase
MQLAVVAAPESWYFKDLQRAAGDEHRVTQVTFRNIQSQVDAGGITAASGDRDLQTFDALLVRTMPPGSLEQVVFRMDVLARLEAAGTPVINPARAIEAAVDKYLATARLHAAGLCVPRTACCQTADEAMLAFAALGGDVVLKPLFGSEGRGITRLADEALAQRAFKLLEELRAVIYLQEFVPHEGADLRVLVIGPRVLGMRRHNPLDWRTNISRGATPSRFDVPADLADLAQRAAAAVGAPLAGVDLLPGRDGRMYTIEVNAVPGWKALAAAHDVDVARLVIEFVVSQASASHAPQR